MPIFINAAFIRYFIFHLRYSLYHSPGERLTDKMPMAIRRQHAGIYFAKRYGDFLAVTYVQLALRRRLK